MSKQEEDRPSDHRPGYPPPNAPRIPIEARPVDPNDKPGPPKEFLTPIGGEPIDWSEWQNHKAIAATEQRGKELTQEQDDLSVQVDKLLLEVEGMSPAENLEKGVKWKETGNTRFKEKNYIGACDAYIRCIYHVKDITLPPEFSPVEYSRETMTTAKSAMEACCANLSLAQFKQGMDIEDVQERFTFMRESVLSAEKCLGINGENLKAKFRMPAARFEYALTLEDKELAMAILKKTGEELRAFLELAPNNLEARKLYGQTKAESQRLRKEIGQEEEKTASTFDFGASIAGKNDHIDLLNDGSVLKLLLKPGQGGQWLSTEWTKPSSLVRCVVSVACSFDKGPEHKLNWVIGEGQVPKIFDIAVKSMLLEEKCLLTVKGSRLLTMDHMCRLRHYLPSETLDALSTDSETSIHMHLRKWEIFNIETTVPPDVHSQGGSRTLVKMVKHGYGADYPSHLSELVVKWTVWSADGALLFGSNIAAHHHDSGRVKTVEKFQSGWAEDYTSVTFLHRDGEMWQPVDNVCAILKQGGKAVVRVSRAPSAEGYIPGGIWRALPDFMKTSGFMPELTISVELIKVRPPKVIENHTDAVRDLRRGDTLLWKKLYLPAKARFLRVRDWLQQSCNSQNKNGVGDSEKDTRAECAHQICECNSAIALCCMLHERSTIGNRGCVDEDLLNEVRLMVSSFLRSEIVAESFSSPSSHGSSYFFKMGIARAYYAEALTHLVRVPFEQDTAAKHDLLAQAAQLLEWSVASVHDYKEAPAELEQVRTSLAAIEGSSPVSRLRAMALRMTTCRTQNQLRECLMLVEDLKKEFSDGSDNLIYQHIVDYRIGSELNMIASMSGASTELKQAVDEAIQMMRELAMAAR